MRRAVFDAVAYQITLAVFHIRIERLVTGSRVENHVVSAIVNRVLGASDQREGGQGSAGGRARTRSERSEQRPAATLEGPVSDRSHHG